jgi:arylsulfatase A-like enzyme
MASLSFFSRTTVFLVLVTLCEITIEAKVTKPNILFILADDLGWNDVSFHGNSQISTPNIDAIGANGAYLNNYYVQPVCSPTRATLLTGRSVIRTGVYDPNLSGNAADLSLNFTLLPQFLKQVGYDTHMVGKWHLGESSFKFTPLKRGFDTYNIGYLGGAEDYFLHGNQNILDFWNGTNYTYEYSCELKDKCPLEKYSSKIFTDAAIKVLEKYKKNDKHPENTQANPFFLYLPMQSVHSPLKAPQAYIDSFNSTVSNPKRRIFAAMVKLLDESVGEVTNALSNFGLLEETIVIFSTDNGGPADFFNSNMACNWPLRGMKRTLFEGGVRGVGAIRGPGINHKGAWLNGLVHVADFLPSLLAHVSSNGNLKEQFGIDLLPGDGINVWDYLSGANQTSPRTYLLHEAHPKGSRDGNGAALRVGDYKIVLRSGSSWSVGSKINTNDGWYGGEGSSDPNIEGAYSLPTGSKTQPYTVKCPPPPPDLKKGFACEQGGLGVQTIEFACLFDVKNDRKFFSSHIIYITNDKNSFF